MRQAGSTNSAFHAFQSADTKGGIEAPLRPDLALSRPADKLSIDLTPDSGRAATLHVRWGMQHLSAAVQVLTAAE